MNYFYSLLNSNMFLGRIDHEHFNQLFFEKPHHAWLNSRPLAKKNLKSFFRLFPERILKRVLRKNIILALCNGNMSATISTPKDSSVILVFPDLLKNLEAADPSDAFAILAHEIGHIYLEHSKQRKSVIHTQHEADMFACKIGLFEEMESLLGRGSSSELTERLYLIRKMHNRI